MLLATGRALATVPRHALRRLLAGPTAALWVFTALLFLVGVAVRAGDLRRLRVLVAGPGGAGRAHPGRGHRPGRGRGSGPPHAADPPAAAGLLLPGDPGLKAARSATPALAKSGAEVVGASLDRVVDSVRELVQTALVVSGPPRLLAPRPAPPAAPSGKPARTGAEVEGAGAADPADDFFGVNSHGLGVLFPDLPEELMSLPLAELRDALLADATAKKKAGPP